MSASSLFPRDIDVWRNSTRERRREGGGGGVLNGWRHPATRKSADSWISGSSHLHLLLLNSSPPRRRTTKHSTTRSRKRRILCCYLGNDRFCESSREISTRTRWKEMEGWVTRAVPLFWFHYIVSANGRRWLTASGWNDGHAWNSKDPEGNPFLTASISSERIEGRCSSYLFPILALQELNLLYFLYCAISFFQRDWGKFMKEKIVRANLILSLQNVDASRNN